MRACLKLWSALAVGLALAATPLRAEFVYVVNAADYTISGYAFSSTGALTPVPGSPFQGDVEPRYIAVDVLGRFVYVSNVNGFISPGTISAYRIGLDGALTPVAGSPFQTTGTPAAIAVYSLGRFVYVANTNGNLGTISAYRIGLDGALTPVAGSPFQTGMEPESIAVDSLSRTAYLGTGHNAVSAHHISPDGALTPVVGSPFPTGGDPLSIAVDVLEQFAYVTNGNVFVAPSPVAAYRIGPQGALKPVAGSPFQTGAPLDYVPISVAVDPLGRFAYVVNTRVNFAGLATVSGYRILHNGALASVGGSPFPASINSIFIAVDLSGHFAYVANLPDNTISAYRIGLNGVLTPVAGSPFQTGSAPFSIAISP
jgi:6-phosphogluconolactonase